MCTGYISACLHIKAILKKGCKSYTEKIFSDTEILGNSYFATAIPEHCSVMLQWCRSLT